MENKSVESTNNQSVDGILNKYGLRLKFTEWEFYLLKDAFKDYAQRAVGEKEIEITELKRSILAGLKKEGELEREIEGLRALNKEGWTKVEYYEKQRDHYKALAEAAAKCIEWDDSEGNTIEQWEREHAAYQQLKANPITNKTNEK